MAGPAITDPFFRQMYSRLAEDLDNRVNAIARGSALIQGADIGVSPEATAMRYQASVSYIEALQAVIELGIELDHDRYGNNRKTIDDGDE